MIRSLFSALGMLIRVLLALVLIAGLILVAFVAYKGSQPMQQDGADGMTYWQFMRERIGAIRELPAKCQQMHFTGYLIAVPVYPVLVHIRGYIPGQLPGAAYPAASRHPERCAVGLMRPPPGGRWWKPSPGMPG